RLKPLLKVEDALAAPEKTLLVIFGDLRKAAAHNGGITRQSLVQFRIRHGALLLASDYPDASLLPFELSCRGQPVYAQGPSIYYKDLQRLVSVHWSDTAHPLCRGLKHGLATHGPSFLQGDPSD